MRRKEKNINDNREYGPLSYRTIPRQYYLKCLAERQGKIP